MINEKYLTSSYVHFIPEVPKKHWLFCNKWAIVSVFGYFLYAYFQIIFPQSNLQRNKHKI